MDFGVVGFVVGQGLERRSFFLLQSRHVLNADSNNVAIADAKVGVPVGSSTINAVVAHAPATVAILSP